MTETTTGTVQKYFPKKDNKPYAIYIGEDKYSTFEDNRVPQDLQENEEVRITWYKNDKGYKTIKSCQRVDTSPSTANTDGAGSERSEKKPMTTDERIERQCSMKVAGGVAEARIRSGEQVSSDQLTSLADEILSWIKKEGEL